MELLVMWRPLHSSVHQRAQRIRSREASNAPKAQSPKGVRHAGDRCLSRRRRSPDRGVYGQDLTLSLVEKATVLDVGVPLDLLMLGDASLPFAEHLVLVCELHGLLSFERFSRVWRGSRAPRMQPLVFDY